MGTLNVYDGNVYLNFGSKDFGAKMSCNGFPTGGLFALLAPIIKNLDGYNVVTFDSKTDRKEMGGYKGNRAFSPKVIAQGNIAEKILKDCGVMTIRREGYESDDLIKKVVDDNYKNFMGITIHTVDMDLSSNIDCAGRVKIQSPTKTSHNVNVGNFEYTVSIDDNVPFNMILPYKVFMGDKSDNIKKAQNFEGRSLWELYKNTIPKYIKNPEVYGHIKAMNFFIKNFCKDLTNEGRAELDMRIKLIYPKEISENFEYKFEDVDKEILKEYLKMLRMKKYLKILTGESEPSMELPKNYLDFWLKTCNNYKSGIYTVDGNGSFKTLDMPNVKLDLIQPKGEYRADKFETSEKSLVRAYKEKDHELVSKIKQGEMSANVEDIE